MQISEAARTQAGMMASAHPQPAARRGNGIDSGRVDHMGRIEGSGRVEAGSRLDGSGRDLDRQAAGRMFVFEVSGAGASADCGVGRGSADDSAATEAGNVSIAR